ncbi:Nurim-like protein, partial [Stegodyphus mimosarum]
MYLWQPIPDWTVWEIVTSKHVLLWWFFSIVHGIAWMAIYSGCFIMDVTELLGVKQVYHHLKGWPKPMNLKSEGLRRFYSHMRHPSFSALAVILFIHPVMHLDRLLLAYTCTIFMLLHFKVDEIDYTYQRRMLQRKAQ